VPRLLIMDLGFSPEGMPNQLEDHKVLTKPDASKSNSQPAHRLATNSIASVLLVCTPLYAQVSLTTVVDLAQRNSSAVKLAEADLEKARAASPRPRTPTSPTSLLAPMSDTRTASPPVSRPWEAPRCNRWFLAIPSANTQRLLAPELTPPIWPSKMHVNKWLWTLQLPTSNLIPFCAN